MEIGIIGTGNMGRSLGILWAERGHAVFFGSREPDKARQAAELAGRAARGGTNDEAARFGQVLLYAVRQPPSEVFTSTDVLDGKVLIDCNNRETPEGFAFEPPSRPSLAEKVASDVPAARVVKAFNTFAQEVFELSPLPLKEYGVSVFVCGDDSDARQTVSTLAEDIGFVAVDCGTLRNAWMVEATGDFIRLLIADRGRGPYATISVRELPRADSERLGGRKSGYK
ncbi:NADPH-dependent F420 reductase [Gloeobacter violaceus]|uniref:Glr0955 protein n=1 Tax=Gloeobacter violaceus (strain ATCC 29082 / PCC 7421) TaxID=251221 RepID=Q7NM14_GLOVI|nr:NADPH-dependent F420 reductase [Gloeobacter violaceus]BAC88896.1 glr0955 [Gloeobacter violaceus PCC 7421]